MAKKLTPFEYGQQAFRKGMSCVPAADKEFLNTYIAGLGVGQGAAELLKEWTKGWTTENLK